MIRDILKDIVNPIVIDLFGNTELPNLKDAGFYWTGQFDGNDLINRNGVNIPYVSGFGVNAVYDFSVLSDVRLDKSNATYWAAVLDSYFYYDAGNPYHSKLKDFHYREFEKQMASDNNFVFNKLSYPNFGYGLNCKSNGQADIPSTTAYGEWEFYVRKDTLTNKINIDILAESLLVDSWLIQLDVDDKIQFLQAGQVLKFKTVAAYMTSGVDYWLKTTRNETINEFVTGAIGTFAWYIKGGVFGNSYILIDTTGGSGTNPILGAEYTDSDLYITDMDVGDSNRDIYINGVLSDTFSATFEPRQYEVDNLKESSSLVIYDTEQTGGELNPLYRYMNYTESLDKYTGEIHRVYFMGDSLTASGNYPDTVGENLTSTWAIIDKGINSNTTTQMLVRFQADIIDDNYCEYVSIFGGINDVLASATAATIKSNLQDMYDLSKGANMKVIALTITPYNNTTAPQQAIIDEVNIWILNTAINIDYALDIYTLLEDPSSPDDLLAAYDSGDGLHLSTLGYETLGTFVYDNVIWN